MGRTKLVAGNWKMNGAGAAARSLAEGLATARGVVSGVDVLVCPPFTALSAVREALAETRIALGAQNMHASASGAFTGEISAPMLVESGCRYVILGHSERRQLFGETDASINAKLGSALGARLLPIVCVGETLAERDSGKASDVVGRQLRLCLAGVAADAADELTIAYEPVWAIGTGRTATPAQAQEMHLYIRDCLGVPFGVANVRIRILYGGSVTPDNAEALLSDENIDGALVGGASLKVESFSAIIDAARRVGR